MLTLEENFREFKDLKLFEIEKIFERKNNETTEKYFLSGVQTSNENIAYYEIQKIVSMLLKRL
jgi:hypothetical protein